MDLTEKKIELLAPGGDVDSIKAAIAAGANAVYCGLDKFNARNRSTDITIESLNGIINLAHRNDCKVFLTLNIIIVESEIPLLINLLNKLVNTKIDGVIVQDVGLFYLLSKYFKSLKIHASTQLTTHNDGQVKFLNKLNATRANLSRELSIDEIKSLALIGHENNIEIEVFVHGSYCIGFSGICYMSSVSGGKSGNRGRCSQPCRDRYLTTSAGKDFPLNLKDNSAYLDLGELYDAGVDSIKIEGRVKKSDYVFTVVNCWKKQIISLFREGVVNDDSRDLYKVFNRNFSNGYLIGDISKDFFIDNPRDNTIKQFAGIDCHSANKTLLKEKIEYYESKTKISTYVNGKITQLSVDKIPIIMRISGSVGAPLEVCVKTPDTSFTVLSEISLMNTGTRTLRGGDWRRSDKVKAIAADSDNCARKTTEGTNGCLNHSDLLERFKSINNTEYHINHLELENLQSNLFLPFKELNSIKKRILFILNGSQEIFDPIDLPSMKRKSAEKIKPDLAVLISSRKDLYLCDKTSAKIFFQLPNCFDNEQSQLIDLFLKSRKLVPWFPSILIGKNYTAAVNFLHQVQPQYIITNNTGIAYEAYREKIDWVAGPYLNIVNSFSLLCLKEKFNCSGSFISNEISRKQIKRIVSPDNFQLYYSIYHPILLLSSRQCLFYQTIGCEKRKVNEDCIRECNKHASIISLNNDSLFIEKTRGNYHCIYNNNNLLNTDIVNDLPNYFSNFLIDLRDIKTATNVNIEKDQVIIYFENMLNGNQNSINEINQKIHPSTNVQYAKGI